MIFREKNQCLCYKAAILKNCKGSCLCLPTRERHKRRGTIIETQMLTVDDFSGSVPGILWNPVLHGILLDSLAQSPKNLPLQVRKTCIGGNERLKSFGDLGDGPGKTKAVEAAAEAGGDVVAIGRPQEAGNEVPAAPAQNTVGACI